MSSTSELERLRLGYRSSRAAVDAAFARELANMTDEEGLKRAQALRLFPSETVRSRESSALIEQQALFQRLAKRQ